MTPRPRPCRICGEPAAEGRVLCEEHMEAYEHSPEHARAACALADFVRRIKAEEEHHV